ncbi:MAG: LacI family DNA-binding transcriptional regulator [Mycobacteriales bacterium]
MHSVRPRRPTLRDVAQRAQVSPTTASFVLAGRDDMRISDDARHRVLRAAAELSYRPNLTARSLRTKVTRTIALVSDTIATEQYAGGLIDGSLSAALAHDHLLFVSESEGDPEVEARLVEDLLGRQVDGFVYASMFTRQVKIPRALVDHPLVLLNCTTRDARIPTVLPDEVGAGRVAARALLDRGHREGIYVVGEPDVDVFAARERMAGILAALADAGAELAGVLDCAWWPEAAYDAVSRFLRLGRLPSALVCMNDRVAFGTYQALQEAGVGIPGDVSVVSFDDSDLASWLRPQLTSVALPHHDLGWRAVELLLAADPAHPATEIERLPMPLRERLSVGPPRTPACAPAEHSA